MSLSLKIFKSVPKKFSLRTILLIALTLLYAVLWIGGIAHHWFIGEMGADKNRLASGFLFLAGMIIFLRCKSRAEFLTLAGAGLIGFAAELSGVHLGFPFGAYNYSDVLQPQIFDVPIAMAFAWIILVAYIKQMLLHFNLPVWIEPILAALWMTSIDLLIDPLAVKKLGYWSWTNLGNYYGIPASNFAGWFVTSLIIFFLFRKTPESNLMTRLMGFSLLFFFTLISLAYNLYLASTAGFVLLLIHILIVRRKRI